MTSCEPLGNISFCRVGGRPIFLDIARDKYLRLPPEAEATFVSQWDSGAATACERLLADYGLRNGTADGAAAVQVPTLPLPRRSALEGIAASASGWLANLLLVGAAIVAARRQLRRQPLLQVLSALAAYRAANAVPPTNGAASEAQPLLEAAAAFRRARPYVPIETVCLLDSIALVRFLARRRLHAQLVFGVTDDPFSAHCWVQADDLVLNDTVGDVGAHTPIRVI